MRKVINRPKIAWLPNEANLRLAKGFTGIVVLTNFDIYYVKKGERHRENGPAYIELSNKKIYFLNDRCHRIGGPALYNSVYVINGKRITKEEHDFLYDLLKLKELI